MSWGHSAKGIGHTANFLGAADLGEFLKKLVAWAKAACAAQPLKEPRAVCELGKTESQGAIRVRSAVFTRLIQVQI